MLPVLAPAGAGALRSPCLGACKGAARPPVAPALQPEGLIWPLRARGRHSLKKASHYTESEKT